MDHTLVVALLVVIDNIYIYILTSMYIFDGRSSQLLIMDGSNINIHAHHAWKASRKHKQHKSMSLKKKLKVYLN